MFKKINKTAFFALIIYPLILGFLTFNYITDYQFGWFEFSLMIIGYYGSNISVGIGLHRLWSHDTYKINKFAELILAIFSAGTLQGPALSWASNHFKHHTYTDTEQDPHSPLLYKNKILGFFWSHMGWMLTGEGSFKSIDRVTMTKLGKNKILRWQLKHYWIIAALMNTAVPAFVGLIFGKTMLAAYAGYLFIGVGRALQQQATFCVNSLCHFIGSQEYAKGTAGDIWWMAIFLLGENWHNFHHAFPSDYRNGAKWYQADVHKWIIFAMSKVGLAWDLKRTAKVRVEAKVSQTLQQYIKLKQDKLSNLQEKVNYLVENLQNKFNELEASSTNLKNRMLKSFLKTQTNLNSIKQQLNQHLKNLEGTSENIVSAISRKVENAENTIQRLSLEFEQIKTNSKI
jgi:stearoyl-CoA desaturase (delta-9 desaturase)